jgi:hypothetical protein
MPTSAMQFQIWMINLIICENSLMRGGVAVKAMKFLKGLFGARFLPLGQYK